MKLPIGVDDFKELVASDLFVDKSLFIKEIIDASDKAILITRPRRWGKTSNLQMLKYFFAIDIDENGVVRKENSNRELFEKLKIATETAYIIDQETRQKRQVEILKDLQGQYPVIYINFKNIKSDSYEEIVKLVQDIMAQIFEQHKYLLNTLTEDSNNYKKFQAIVNNAGDITDIKDSMRFLSELLKKHFNKRVYILVDEYDAIFNFLLESAFDSQEKHDVRIEVALLITSMLSACGKGNDDNLEKIIMTGVLDTLKKECGSGFNNVSVYGILDGEFSISFGFSEQEINEQLLSKFNLDDNTKATVSKNIKDWYNGYKVPVYGYGSIQVYTPWSVMKYLNAVERQNLKPESYWSRSGSSAIFGNLLKSGVEKKLRDKLISLSQGEKQELDFKKGITLVREQQENYRVDDYRRNEKIVSYLLLNSGYLTAEWNGNKYVFYVPNFEVKEELVDCIDEELQLWDQFRISDPFVEGMIKAKEEIIRDELVNYIHETFSSLDIPKSDSGNEIFSTEKAYQLFLLGLIHKMHQTHIIKSEIEVGRGRPDIVILPRAIDGSFGRAAEGIGFVIELKRMSADMIKNKTLAALAEEGLEQIKRQKYQTILTQHDVANKIFMSVAFYGKEVSILIEKELTKTFDPDIEWSYVQCKISKILW